MKHRIRWLVLIGVDIVLIAIAIIIAELFYPTFGQLYGSRYVGYELTFLLAVVLFLFHAFFGIHKVELSDSSMKLTGFQIQAVGKDLHKKTIVIPYKDVYQIKAVSLPLFGVIRIKLKSNHFRKEFSFSCLYTKHKKLFETLCQNVRHSNPNALIDEKLNIFIDT
ncbi:MAG: hypothetical protein IKL10_04350 [Clostridia bacterium]|nr:hypothetical protein [Clostridia bacterium]